MAQAVAVNQGFIWSCIKEDLGSLKKIWFINPRNTVGNDSGRINILDLIAKLGPQDGVVWDNFPDDLVRVDLENARNVLEMLTQRMSKDF